MNTTSMKFGHNACSFYTILLILLLIVRLTSYSQLLKIYNEDLWFTALPGVWQLSETYKYIFCFADMNAW